MNGRLAFTAAAFARRVEMSYQKRIFIVVEGKEHDRYFVDKLCRSSDHIGQGRYEICLASQINRRGATSAGGKESVLSLHDYYRRSHKLVQKNSAGPRSICFFVDRDAQQITGGMRRSPHIIYTLLADVEAHIFADANEVEAIAAAASLDLPLAEEVVNYIGDWRQDLADSWRPWIEECYVAQAVRARCWVGFGQAASRIHTGPNFRSLDNSLLQQARISIERCSPLSGTAFSARRNKVIQKIARVYSSGKQSSLLKGKWLPSHITLAVEGYFNASVWPDGWNSNSFKESVTRCYLANLDTASGNPIRLRKALEALV